MCTSISVCLSVVKPEVLPVYMHLLFTGTKGHKGAQRGIKGHVNREKFSFKTHKQKGVKRGIKRHKGAQRGLKGYLNREKFSFKTHKQTDRQRTSARVELRLRS